jgi:hypothetical protein
VTARAARPSARSSTAAACANPLCAETVAADAAGSVTMSQDGASWRLCGLWCALAYLRLCAARCHALDRRQAEAEL